jgi:predicted O-methyltransferase YrrM
MTSTPSSSSSSTSTTSSSSAAEEAAKAYVEHVRAGGGTSMSIAKAEPISLSSQLYAYLLSVGVRENKHLQRLRELTAAHPLARMATPPDEVSLLQFLIRLTGAKKAIEVGVFTGYSALGTALALPADGKLIALDVNEEFANIGKPVWEEAGVGEKIDLRLAPAVESLDQLIANSSELGSFDFAFVDADKVNYLNYYERLLKLIRPGGLIAFDNTLWHGKVVDESVNDEDTVAIRSLNAKLKDDPRVEITMIAIADGLTLVRILPH